MDRKPNMSNDSRTPFSLAGKVALVTGSSKGLGKAMAFGLGRAGAAVAINYANNRESAERTFAEFKAKGYKGMLVRADATDKAAVDGMVKAVAKELGSPDIIVINSTCDQPQRPVEEYDWDFFQTMLDFFIKSPYLLTRACLPHMKERRWGRIINIGSEVVQRALGNFSAYVAAKGGQNGLTRSLSTELARYGITCNTISPGWIPVERHDKDPQDAKDAYRALIPADRWGVPDDVAGAVVFLASQEAGFITGQNIAVNGGLTTA